jgi:hypothetical protein
VHHQNEQVLSELILLEFQLRHVKNICAGKRRICGVLPKWCFAKNQFGLPITVGFRVFFGETGALPEV